MQLISPVLAGTFDTAAYQPAATNIGARPVASDTVAVDGVNSVSGSAAVADFTTTIGSSAVSPNDPRRYSKFDHSASNAGDAPNFSFGDFLDMVNPLQHVPVVSAVYRAVTGDTINPISRVAGDIMYGGIVGAASAVVGGIGAIGNAVTESQTGKDTTGQVYASLFGDDKNATTQVASASSAAPAASGAALTSLAAVQQQALAPLPASASAAATIAPATAPASTAIAASGKSFPLTPNSRLPYGGVMDTGNSVAAQNSAIALAEGSHAMRLGHTIYTSPLMNGPHPLPVASAGGTAAAASAAPGSAAAAMATATAPASADPPAAASATAATLPAAATPPAISTATAAANDAANAASIAAITGGPAGAAGAASASGFAPIAASGAAHNPIPQNLVDDMVMMRALSQYKGVAAGPSSLGANLDIRN